MNYEKFVKDNSRNYKIIEMKFKQGKSHKEISDILNISSITIGENYRVFSWNLYKCYFHYLQSIGLEFDATDISNFYESSSHAVAYLEKTYSEELSLFRGDKPPVFLEYVGVKSLPPYRKLTSRQLSNLEKKVVYARENQGRTFVVIGKELKITDKKARWIYKHYYHKKVLQALERIDAHTESDYSSYIFDYSIYSLKRWELIVSEYFDLVQDLIDN